MLENFIYAKDKYAFKKELEAGNILDEAIVFIEDTKEVWNHGTYFGGIIGLATPNNDGLMSSLDKEQILNLDKYANNVVYGTCNTAATDGTKIVTISDPNYNLKTNDIIIVYFTNTNTCSYAASLSVNGVSGTIRCNGGKTAFPGDGTAECAGVQKEYIAYLYAGYEFKYLGSSKLPTTMSQTEATAGTQTTARLISAKVLNDTITSKTSKKLDIISDLSTIRNNASKGATAVLPDAISDMETKTHASETYALKESIPTKVSLLSNDVPYVIDEFDDGLYIMDASTKLWNVEEWTLDKGYIGVTRIVSNKIYVLDPNAYSLQFANTSDININNENWGTDDGYYNTSYLNRQISDLDNAPLLLEITWYRTKLFNREWYLPSPSELSKFVCFEGFYNVLEIMGISPEMNLCSSAILADETSYANAIVQCFSDYSEILVQKGSPTDLHSAYAMWSAPYKKPVKTRLNTLEQTINRHNYEDGVYVVNQYEQLLPIDKGTSDCIAVAVIQGPHKFYIEKNNNFYDVSLLDSGMRSDIEYSFVDECLSTHARIYDSISNRYNNNFVLPDYTKWTDGALSDFNGYENTKKGTLELLNNFNTSLEQQYNDWYIPSLGLIGIIYTLRNEINNALLNIGGTLLDLSTIYGSNTKDSGNCYYAIYFKEGTTYQFDYTTTDNMIYNRETITIRLIRNFELPKTIKELETKIDNTNIAYGTCSTPASTKDKIINIEGNENWQLAVGSVIMVKFSATNTASNPTFNVNDTGAKSVTYNTSTITTSNLSYAGYANRTIEYVYNGTNWVFLGWSYNTAYSSMTATEATNGTSTSSRLITPKILHDKISDMIEGKQDTIEDLETIRQNANIISNVGEGNKFLADDGTYKSVGSDVTEETVSDWGFAKQEDVDLPQINQTELVYTIQPNVFNVWGEVATLDITLGEEQEGIVNEFLFQFTSGATPTTLILPDTIKWVNDAPEIEANMTYQCSIINNIGVICGVQ